MKVLYFAILLLFTCLQGVLSVSKCYECGWKQRGEGQPEPMNAETPFCYTDASFTDELAKDCPDDCCYVLKEETEIEHEGNKATMVMAFHGCLFASNVTSHDFTCNIEGNRQCHETDLTLPGHEGDFIRSEMCICTDDLCNKKEPEPTGSPAPPEGPMCYDCGYKQVDGGEAEELPEGVAFCKDFTKPTEDHATSCPKDDCCATVKEYTTEGGKSVVVGRHACLSTINHEYNKTCSPGAEETCSEYSFNRGDVSVKSDFCTCNDQNLCNNKEPHFPSGSERVAPTVIFVVAAILMKFY